MCGTGCRPTRTTDAQEPVRPIRPELSAPVGDRGQLSSAVRCSSVVMGRPGTGERRLAAVRQRHVWAMPTRSLSERYGRHGIRNVIRSRVSRTYHAVALTAHRGRVARQHQGYIGAALGRRDQGAQKRRSGVIGPGFTRSVQDSLKISSRSPVSGLSTTGGFFR